MLLVEKGAFLVGTVVQIQVAGIGSLVEIVACVFEV